MRSEARPRVGVVAAWIDPERTGVWSGLPANVIAELRRLEVYAGHRDVTPWPPASRAIHRALARLHRQEGGALSAPMRALARVSDAVHLMAPTDDVDGWVHLVGAQGRVVRGRYATLFEMSPSQLVDAATRWRGSLGYPGVTRSRIEWVARRQESVYRHAHACCVASRWMADSLVRDHGIEAARVHVVGYGRNVDIAPPSGRDWSTPRFLFVGNDWERKNGDAVVRAFVKLRQEIPAARLDIVSDHPPVNVEGVIEHGTLATSGPFAVFDPVVRAQFEELFASATCLVVPSRFEPFGLVYVEAAAAGVASIVGRAGGSADAVGDGGVRVDPDDPDALYRAMRELADPATAQHLGGLAQHHAADLTWAKTTQRVVRALDLAPIAGVELADFR